MIFEYTILERRIAQNSFITAVVDAAKLRGIGLEELLKLNGDGIYRSVVCAVCTMQALLTISWAPYCNGCLNGGKKLARSNLWHEQLHEQSIAVAIENRFHYKFITMARSCLEAAKVILRETDIQADVQQSFQQSRPASRPS